MTKSKGKLTLTKSDRLIVEEPKHYNKMVPLVQDISNLNKNYS